MIYTKIRLGGLSNVDLPISGATSLDAYILKGADGLGPPDVDVFMSNTINQGNVYQNRRPQNRQVVLRVGLNPDFSSGQNPSDLRATLYGLLTPGTTDIVTLSIMNGASVLLTTTGYISRMVPNPFSKDPEVQITLDCIQPYLLGPSNTVSTGSMSKTSPSITNIGTAPTGFDLAVTLTANMSLWSWTDANSKKLQFTYAFLSGDIITIKTQAGVRSATRTRSAVVLDLLPYMTTDSIWHQLKGGANVFTTNSSSFNFTSLAYIPRYWGV